ncbi:MAG: glutaredoxin 3 [Rickettsia sp.]|nr:glutaredoxin 3 [Rickettsia sp.]
MEKIIIYSKNFCPFCKKSKNFFDRHDLQYEEIIVDTEDLKEKMIQKSNGRKTFPQIFIGEQHIGGYDDLIKLEKSVLEIAKK